MNDFDLDGPAAADSGLFGLGVEPKTAKAVVIPVPFDATASFQRGAAQAPQAILKASHQVDLFDPSLGNVWKHGISLLEVEDWIIESNREAQRGVDAWRTMDRSPQDTPATEDPRIRVNAIGEKINRWVLETTHHWLDQKKIVGLVGGDHSTPWGCIQAHSERVQNLGILHIDAHADLRSAYEGFTWSHASIMHNVMEHCRIKRLIQVGVRDYGFEEAQRIRDDDRISTFFGTDLARRKLRGDSWQSAVEEIVALLPPQTYVSFDIDGLDPTFCPHTGTPVPGGLAFDEAWFLLEAVIESGRRIVGFDLTEVVPSRTAAPYDQNVAARLLYKLAGLALRNRASS